ncbi:MAG: 30S ribosomal protein S3 [Candidatus Magasanikbacteria bacterium GW2011_GWC2_37_14]|uniref:Small ribosomal subunit protein uS3 n=1 Tax=Candidatus Magasanikbacteria bacterium GW2011_GWC2_37_14 TaxID=1619046 RepID=A0A0G0GLV6_9BACT|nr:MAG: 30S ribosomal protein S3 [Candidatus Magasanikbacteria bacterium GW2011_GWC2_37_14]
MGHKVHPKAHRMQVIYTWDSRWYAKKDYAKFAEQENKIRDFLSKKFKEAHIDAVGIERGPKELTVNIAAAKPGIIIGRAGKGLEDLKKELEKKYLQMSLRVKLNIKEVTSPALSAQVIAQTMVADIEKRIPFRRVMKQTVERVMKAGAKGVKVVMAGRLNGVEIARREKIAAGTVPLITLRSDVDYALCEAQTLYGKIGVKVWVCHGKVFGRKEKFAEVENKKEETNKEEKKVVKKFVPRTAK